MSVDLIAEFVSDSRNSARVLHAAMVWIGRRKEIFVRMDGVIVKELVAKVISQLCKKTTGYQS